MDKMATQTATPPESAIPTQTKNWTDQGIKAMTAEKLRNAPKGQKSNPHRIKSCLYLRVFEDGRKYWIFRWRDRYQTNAKGIKKLRDMGLGSYGKADDELTLAEARQLAAKWRAVVKAGEDPIIERNKEKALNAPDAVPTFTECREAYIMAHSPSWSNPKHAQQWTNTLKTYAEPSMGKLAVNLINDEHVFAVLDAIWLQKTETAVRLRGRIEKVLAWAEAKGYRKGMPNPARRDGPLSVALPAPSKIRKVKHHKSLPYPALNPFIKELRDQKGIAPRALEFTILTATRTGETIGAEWSEVDFDSAVWTIPAKRMKANKAHRVPLTDAALKVLKEQQGLHDKWVFPGTREGKHLSNMAMLQMLKGMEKDFTVHGFRSTFKNWAAERTNFSRQVVEFALAHVNRDTTEAAYLHSDLLEKRVPLMDQWAKYVNRTPQKGNIVSIKAKGAV